ncbi:MAG: YggS family pyridoxal phosphate enzyme [Spartobacteria bacterium Tous-C9RFEB]|nr:MAG: YggS family pyridoxal phosphate enzyme [Spartobacteria bacterium Tous-C9RFEB]
MSQISNNLINIHSRIQDAAHRVGRQVSDVRLVAVSKTYPPAVIQEAWNAGQHVFGENRVQDALPKIAELPAEAKWHFIGHLQSNKIRKALPAFTLIHGVDNLELAQQINRIAGEMGLTANILLEINVSGEASKFGFSPTDLRQNLEGLLCLPNIRINGLMTMAPYSEDPETARPVFSKLRILRDELAAKTGQALRELSMGMSGDFEVGIEEGATIVRIGSSIFGHR